MTIEYQIKMIDDLIAENSESTVKDFAELKKDIEAIENQVLLGKISKADYSKINLLDFRGR